MQKLRGNCPSCSRANELPYTTKAKYHDGSPKLFQDYCLWCIRSPINRSIDAIEVEIAGLPGRLVKLKIQLQQKNKELLEIDEEIKRLKL